MHKQLCAFLLCVLFFPLNSAYAVTRECTSSSHQIIGDVQLANGSSYKNLYMYDALVAPVTASGSALFPADARRAACYNASSLAVQAMSNISLEQLGQSMCSAIKSLDFAQGIPPETPGNAVIYVTPRSVYAQGRHGTETNESSRIINYQKRFIDCNRPKVLFKYPIWYPVYSTYLLQADDFCYNDPVTYDPVRAAKVAMCQSSAHTFCRKWGYKTFAFLSPRSLKPGEVAQYATNTIPPSPCKTTNCKTFEWLYCLKEY